MPAKLDRQKWPAKEFRKRRWMMKRVLGGVSIIIVFLLSAGAALAQGQPQQAPPTFESVTERAWTGVHNKILNMVKDFPEDKYKSHPGDDTRDFVGEVRHIMVGMDMVAGMLKGEQVDFTARTAYYDGRPATKASLTADYETSMNACLELIKKSPNPRVIGWTEHAGEHYGKLVSIYRINGLVPPTTRAQQERQQQQGSNRARISAVLESGSNGRPAICDFAGL